MINWSRIVGRKVGSADEKRTLAEKMEIGLRFENRILRSVPFEVV